MRSLITLLLLTCVLLTAPTATGQAAQPAVEKGLLPAILIEGHDTTRYDIYERMERYKVPGVGVAVIDGERIAWAAGYGVKRAGGSDSIGTLTIFQAASISKPVAAVGALRLVDEERLALDQDVNVLLRSWTVPESRFTATEPLTLRRLLSHTAGTTVHGFPGYARGVPVPTTTEVLDGVGNTAPVVVDTIPGALWRYSGGGYTIAQLIVSDLTERSFAEYMREAVLQPIGMRESTFEQPLPEGLADVAAVAHGWDGEPVTGDWHAYPEQAAAGLWTTPSDLARFAIEISRALNGDANAVLRRETAVEMLTPVLDGTYGLGFGVMGEGGELRFSHGGANEGYRCYLVMYPRTGQGLVVMTNGDGGSDLAVEIHRAVSDVYGWPHTKPETRRPAPVDPALLAELAGVYEASFGMRYTLTAAEDKLLVDGTRRYPRELYPASESEFFGAEMHMDVRFNRDDAGAVTSLSVLRGGGEIVLEKVR